MFVTSSLTSLSSSRISPSSDFTPFKPVIQLSQFFKSLYMSDRLARVLKEFSESKNLKQREVVEGALIDL